MHDPHADDQVRRQLDELYRRDGRRAFATLARLLGDLDLAEEALQDALRAALERWPVDGVPDNPVAWLVTTGRFQTIDRLRRQRRYREWEQPDATAGDAETREPGTPLELDDDRLRLIFTCCHPALAEDARLSLTLREVCELTTEQIAAAFVLPTPTLAQRIVRAKAKIRAAKIPFEVPSADELPARIRSVLRVVYLVFNEGYSASSGDAVLRVDLGDEAIRLARLLQSLLPHPEVDGLLALLLLQQSRRDARTDRDGELVPLEEQDRSRWDRAQIDEGSALVERSLRSTRFGSYTLQAAIAAVHAEATDADATDWAQIVGLYDELLRREPTPIVALNRAVAVAMRDGPAAGLALVDALLADGRLDRYHLAHAARGELCRRLGRVAEARGAFTRAAALTAQEPERRFLARRLRELDGPPA